MLFALLVVMSLVLVNAFFVAAEYALVRIRRTQVEALVAAGSSRAKGLLRALDHINHYVAGVQVGITFAGLASGRFAEPALAAILAPLLVWLLPSRLEASPAVITTISMIFLSYLLVVIGELVPKALTLQFTQTIALLVARPLQLAVALFTPFVWSMNGLGNSILKLLRVQTLYKEGAYSVDELNLLIVQSHKAGILEDVERQLTQNSLLIADRSARDIMVPRVDIIGLNAQWSIRQILDQVAGTIHARLPVFDGDWNNLLGIVHLHDLFRQYTQKRDSFNIREFVRPALFVPEAIKMQVLLDSLRREHTQIALVVDEHGTIIGLVTLEDIVEEIFGEIHDVLEVDEPTITKGADGVFLARGDVHLREVNQRLGWNLIDDEADTIAGLVMNRLGRTAKRGDSVETPYGTVHVEKMAGMRIIRVSLAPKPSGNTST